LVLELPRSPMESSVDIWTHVSDFAPSEHPGC
jgi:hypothetical protein